jgi:cleavage and polyadenylation specificity factor subunit 1
LTDEESDVEPAKVISASFADPYVLLIRDDFSAMILTEDGGDLDEVTKGNALKQGKWLSGSLYEDSNDVLRLEFPEESEDEAGNVLLFLLSITGGLQVREHYRHHPSVLPTLQVSIQSALSLTRTLGLSATKST